MPRRWLPGAEVSIQLYTKSANHQGVRLAQHPSLTPSPLMASGFDAWCQGIILPDSIESPPTAPFTPPREASQSGDGASTRFSTALHAVVSATSVSAPLERIPVDTSQGCGQEPGEQATYM